MIGPVPVDAAVADLRIALVVLCAAGAAALLVGPRRAVLDRLGARQDRADPRPGVARAAAPAAAAVVGTVGALALGGTALLRVLAPVGVGLAVARVLLALHRRHRADARATQCAERVRETCEALAAELAAGRPPGAALERAAEEWPVLAPVAEAHRVGADVPAAWRAASTVPGGGDLRLVAAAWQVAHRTGHGLAHAVARVATDLRRARGTRRIVAGELASARATARLVAALPVAALLMGSGVGGDPVGFLLGHPVGLACLAAGAALGLTGIAWIEALAREAGRGS